MNDTKLYEQILGLQPPWSVQSVTLKRDEGSIEVEVGCTETLWGCPTCGKRMHAHGVARRRWRHLDSCQYKTILVADVPRVKCDEHGTQVVQVPWAEKYGRARRCSSDWRLTCFGRARWPRPARFCASVGMRPMGLSNGRSTGDFVGESRSL